MSNSARSHRSKNRLARAQIVGPVVSSCQADRNVRVPLAHARSMERMLAMCVVFFGSSPSAAFVCSGLRDERLTMICREPLTLLMTGMNLASTDGATEHLAQDRPCSATARMRRRRRATSPERGRYRQTDPRAPADRHSLREVRAQRGFSPPSRMAATDGSRIRWEGLSAVARARDSRLTLGRATDRRWGRTESLGFRLCWDATRGIRQQEVGNNAACFLDFGRSTRGGLANYAAANSEARLPSLQMKA